MPTPQAQEPGINHELLVDKHGNRPTHMNQRLYHKETGRSAQDSLTQYVGFWPTPDVGMTQGGRALPEGTSQTGMTPDGRKVQVGLTNAVKMFPTPQAGDNRDRGHANMPAIQRRIANGKQVMLSMEIQQAKGQKLSAAWTLVLMGYSPDWCDLED